MCLPTSGTALHRGTTFLSFPRSILETQNDQRHTTAQSHTVYTPQYERWNRTALLRAAASTSPHSQLSPSALPLHTMADGTHAADTRGDATTMPPSITATPSLPPSVYLLSGGVAGLSVDLVLFPLDTIKTRMQSRGGLTQSGGFRKLFSGIASAAAGSGQRTYTDIHAYTHARALRRLKVRACGRCGRAHDR